MKLRPDEDIDMGKAMFIANQERTTGENSR